jgi:hypothetical protein
MAIKKTDVNVPVAVGIISAHSQYIVIFGRDKDFILAVISY